MFGLAQPWFGPSIPALGLPSSTVVSAYLAALAARFLALDSDGTALTEDGNVPFRLASVTGQRVTP